LQQVIGALPFPYSAARWVLHWLSLQHQLKQLVQSIKATQSHQKLNAVRVPLFKQRKHISVVIIPGSAAKQCK